ncbi:uncharacterized protein LOC127553988 isoform X2 [Antechinus flavipes]|uniref:uncharacterized protein LOC127553988 isoform X2 n=1 Tax=Antechinus flavipes TaxID=38775 RepID=UPI0022358BC3|nr:uncharacterized protein LOC127553988 isoform X2 [Antechinus flavipes]
MSVMEISPLIMENVTINKVDDPDETVTIYAKDEKKQTKGGREKTIMQEGIHDKQTWDNNNENIPTNMGKDGIYHVHNPNENDEESKFGVNKKEGAGDNYRCNYNDDNIQITMKNSEIAHNNDSDEPEVDITNIQIDKNLQKSDNMIKLDKVQDHQAWEVNMCKIAENKEDSCSDSGGMTMVEISPQMIELIFINRVDDPDETITIYVKDVKKQTNKGGRENTIVQESIHDQHVWKNNNENILRNMEKDGIYHVRKPNEPEACSTMELNDKVNQSNSEQIERMISEKGGGDQQACNANISIESFGKHQICKDNYSAENDEESRLGMNKKKGAGDNYVCDCNDGVIQVTMENNEITHKNDSNEGGIWFTAPATDPEDEDLLPTFFDEEIPTYFGWEQSMWCFLEGREKFYSYFGEPDWYADEHSYVPTYREPAYQYPRLEKDSFQPCYSWMKSQPLLLPAHLWKIDLWPSPEITEDTWPIESERISDTSENTIEGKSSKKRRMLSFFRCCSWTSRKQKKVHYEKQILGDSERTSDEDVSEDKVSPDCCIFSCFFSSRK